MSGRPSTTPSGYPEVAPLGRRIPALLIDWIACLAITNVVLAQFIEITPAWVSFGPLLVLFVENLLLVSLVGGTLGHRIMGITVVALGRPYLTPLHALIRAVLLCLFIPLIVVGQDGRGLHDRLAGTSIVTRASVGR